MPKPTNTIDWTPDPGDIEEPAAGDKLVGFAVGFRPPAQWFNWFWELVTQWVQWIDADLAEVGSFTVAINATSGGTYAYTRQRGRYSLVGNLCVCDIDIEWQNSNAGAAGNAVVIDLPYRNQIDANSARYGAVVNAYSNFGTQNAASTQWGLVMPMGIGTLGTATIEGATNAGAAVTTIANGNAEVRRCVGRLIYPHTGVGNYGGETPTP